MPRRARGGDGPDRRRKHQQRHRSLGGADQGDLLDRRRRHPGPDAVLQPSVAGRDRCAFHRDRRRDTAARLALRHPCSNRAQDRARQRWSRCHRDVANIVGVKDAAGHPGASAALLAAAPGLELYSGDDNLTLAFLAIGACGAISVASHWNGLQQHEMLARSPRATSTPPATSTPGWSSPGRSRAATRHRTRFRRRQCCG